MILIKNTIYIIMYIVVGSGDSMNLFEKFLYMLQAEIETPKPLGWYHILWILIVLISIIILFIFRKNNKEKQLKIY